MNGEYLSLESLCHAALTLRSCEFTGVASRPPNALVVREPREYRGLLFGSLVFNARQGPVKSFCRLVRRAYSSGPQFTSLLGGTGFARFSLPSAGDPSGWWSPRRRRSAAYSPGRAALIALSRLLSKQINSLRTMFPPRAITSVDLRLMRPFAASASPSHPSPAMLRDQNRRRQFMPE